MTWREEAACRGRTDLDWFQQEDKPGGRNRDQVANREACLALCAECPVKGPCLDDALATEDHFRFGIRGGLTAAQRGRMPRARRRRSVALCGTDAGYYRHIRSEGTEPCRECREAHAFAQLTRKRQRAL